MLIHFDSKGRLVMSEDSLAVERFDYQMPHYSAEKMLSLLRHRTWEDRDREYRLGPPQLAALKVQFCQQITKAGGQLDIDGVRYTTEDGKNFKAAMIEK